MRRFKSPAWTAAALIGLAFVVATPASADFVILDDLIVDGSACIGFDCVDGEVFSFDTIRLKENNLRIKFDDTSVVPGFPSNDWQLLANESANGGASKFAIEDVSGGRTPFTVEANAPSHSLYVDDGGRIGIRTSTPAVEIHVIDGDTPTLRLEQNNSSGFEPQTWDVAGNETNFFVRDVTHGSQLPLRIRPDAPTNSIFIDVGGDVGFGTSSPDDPLHILEGDASRTSVLVQNSNASAQNTDVRLMNSSGTWAFRNNTAGNFLANQEDDGAIELQVDPDGNLTVGGNITATTVGSSIPDYVFDDDYDLMSLAELEAFVSKNKHLPGIPSKAQVDQSGGALNMTEMQLLLLEKVEELTLYTLEQHERFEKLTRETLEQQRIIDDLRERLATLEPMTE